MDPGKHEADRYRIDGRDIELHPLRVGLIDPHAAFELSKYLGFPALRLIIGTRLALKNPGITPVNRFGTNQPEVEGIGDLKHKFAILFPVLFLFLQPFAAVRLGFLLAFVDDLLNLLFFFLRILGRERLVILCRQPLRRRAARRARRKSPESRKSRFRSSSPRHCHRVYVSPRARCRCNRAAACRFQYLFLQPGETDPESAPRAPRPKHRASDRWDAKQARLGLKREASLQPKTNLARKCSRSAGRTRRPAQHNNAR